LMPLTLLTLLAYFSSLFVDETKTMRFQTKYMLRILQSHGAAI